MEILDKRADALVEDGEIFRFTLEDGIVVAAMPIPFAVIQSDHPRARFDQAPGH